MIALTKMVAQGKESDGTSQSDFYLLLEISAIRDTVLRN